jgi:membrane-bound lytic murein transglycosylase B
MFEALSLAPTPPLPPGQLTEMLEPSGFEALAGVTPAKRLEHPPSHEPALAKKSVQQPPIDRTLQRKRERALQTERRKTQARMRAATAALERAKQREAKARRDLASAEAKVQLAEQAVVAARGRAAS